MRSGAGVSFQTGQSRTLWSISPSPYGEGWQTHPCPLSLPRSLPASPGRLQLCLGTRDSRMGLERANRPWSDPKPRSPWTLPAPGWGIPRAGTCPKHPWRAAGKELQELGSHITYPGNPNVFLPSLQRESLPCSFQSPNLVRCCTQNPSRMS